MGFKAIFANLSRRRCIRRRGQSYIAPEAYVGSSSDLIKQSQWADMPPELLLDIIHRVDATETSWPARRDVLACASVCKSWREITKEIVKTPEECGRLTFPISLKQPGPRDFPIQCFIKRERANSTYGLYLGLSPALSGDMSKLLLAARKTRKGMSIEFLISLVRDDFSRTSNAFVGKLKSNFLGTKFTIYDNQPWHDPAAQSNRRALFKVGSNQVYPRVSASNVNVGTISYELNILRTRGPRRMQCTMHAIPFSAIQEGGTAPTPVEFPNRQALHLPSSPVLKGNEKFTEFSSTCLGERQESVGRTDPLVLKNKAPRWHEHLQCWCLNFKGRVTVASVKNFQLVAATDSCENVPAAEQERVILQFGKIAKDIFTMDYHYPLSAFQAFAICLSSFDTKPACE